LQPPKWHAGFSPAGSCDSARKGLVTDAFRRRSPRECLQPAPADAAVGTFGALPFASMIPSFQSPGLRKHPGVGLDDLLQTERVGYRFPWSTELAFTSSAL
jgi:hypothetical protein